MAAEGLRRNIMAPLSPYHWIHTVTESVKRNTLIPAVAPSMWFLILLCSTKLLTM
jgi:hypothetical protein